MVVSLASTHGVVKHNPKLTLCDVFYVHGLNCNLTSIAQLINDLLCTIIFTQSFV